MANRKWLWSDSDSSQSLEVQKRMIAQGKCRRCGKPRNRSRQHCDECLVIYAGYRRKYRQRDKTV